MAKTSSSATTPNSAAPRIPPILPENFTAEQKTLVGDWSNLNFSRVIVAHPGMYKVFLPYIAKVIPGTNLPPREREILVLRTLALCDEVYELHHHVLIARNAGMSEAEIDAAKASGSGLSDFDRLLITATEELVAERNMSDATWQALAQKYSQEQMMEVVFLVGCYVVMAMLTKGFGIPLEDETGGIEKLRKYT